MSAATYVTYVCTEDDVCGTYICMCLVRRVAARKGNLSRSVCACTYVKAECVAPSVLEVGGAWP